MPDVTQRSTTTTTARTTSGGSSTASGGRTGAGERGNAAAQDDLRAGAKPRVVAYLTQNSTTHQNDEIPETLAALQKADQSGLGKKSLIPISDPYADGHETDGYTFGSANKDKLGWWQGDPSLQPGQAKLGAETLTLGVDDPTGTSEEAVKIGADWSKALIALGMDAATTGRVVAALFKDSDGNPKLYSSGGRACNELMQMVYVLYRAEQGEFELSGIVLSGHHYSGTDYLFGESAPHEYDTKDSFNFHDLEALKPVFPKAFADVDSVQFSACNTHDIAMNDAQGNEQSTADWVKNTFPNSESSAWWSGIAPGSDMASFFSGEFALDQAKKEKGDSAAFGDALFRQTSKGEFHRGQTGADGKMAETPLQKNGSSYSYNDYKGLRNSNGQAFHKRPDLMKYVHQK